MVLLLFIWNLLLFSCFVKSCFNTSLLCRASLEFIHFFFCLFSIHSDMDDSTFVFVFPRIGSGPCRSSSCQFVCLFLTQNFFGPRYPRYVVRVSQALKIFIHWLILRRYFTCKCFKSSSYSMIWGFFCKCNLYYV